MIKIIQGSYGYKGRIYDNRNGTLDFLSKEQEQRLIELGVAQKVEEKKSKSPKQKKAAKEVDEEVKKVDEDINIQKLVDFDASESIIP